MSAEKRTCIHGAFAREGVPHGYSRCVQCDEVFEEQDVLVGHFDRAASDGIRRDVPDIESALATALKRAEVAGAKAALADEIAPWLRLNNRSADGKPRFSGWLARYGKGGD